MTKKPTYEELEQRIKELEKEAIEHKQAKEALKETEQKYQHLTESLLDTVYEFDRKGRFTYVNEAGAHMFGYSKQEILNGLLVQDTMVEEVRDLSQRAIGEIFKGNSTVGERTFLRKDGTQFIGEIHSGPIYKGEEVVGVRGVLRDITSSKQVEEALRESELKFRGLFDLSPQAITVTEVETGRLIDVNDTFCKLTKYNKEEVLGRTTTELGFYSKEDRNRFIGKLQPSGEIHGFEMDFKAKDGFIINSVMFARHIQLKGKAFIITAFLDMTERKLLESQLLQSQKMEAIGTLAGGIAHNFNNLLMSIQGNTSLMLLDTNANHPHYARLTNIETSVQNGSKLTSQLLGYARGGGYEVKPISINRIITDTSATFSMTRKDITLYQDLEHNLSWVKADPGQIEQVILNIYVNAAEAMPHGGELFITTRNITRKDIKGKSYTIKPGNYILLTIRDTGTGMDKHTQAKVFDPFFTTKGLARGTGLGLASVYGIIKAHGGYIDVESQKGHGTTFFIYLPASKETIGEEVKIPGTIEKGKETILLVDDEEIILDVGEALLTSLGYTVLIAHGGKEAIEIVNTTLESSPPDLVILDMIMPHMGGGETYDKLKEIHPTIKVLLSSGYSIDGQATEILKRGCNGFIQKPFTMRELSKAIREVLGEG